MVYWNQRFLVDGFSEDGNTWGVKSKDEGCVFINSNLPALLETQGFSSASLYSCVCTECV